jgi:hypothetical protein
VKTLPVSRQYGKPKQKTGRANQLARPVFEPERFFRHPFENPDCGIASSVLHQSSFPKLRRVSVLLPESLLRNPLRRYTFII